VDNLQQLRADREVAKNTVLQLRDVLKRETRDFNTEERASWDKANADFDALDSRIALIEKGDDVEKRFGQAGGGKPGTEDRRPGERRQKGGRGPDRARMEAEARGAWFAHKSGRPLTRAQVEACRAVGINPKLDRIDIPFGGLKRDLSVVTNTAGEHTIAEGFVAQLEKSLLAFGNVRAVADVMVTPKAEPLPWPTVSDHGNAAELLAENTGAGEADPTFGVVTFGAFKISSKLVQVPNELMQDSAFDMASLLGGLLGERIARKENAYFTTGAGSTEPKGVVTGASSGVTAASATVLTFDEIIDLQHSVDPAYRTNPGAGYMLNDTTLKAVRKLKDANGQYLWQPSNERGVPSMLLNYPVYVNQQMASPATGTKPVIFGDFKKFKIRQAGGVRLRRLDERYAEADQTAFLAFLRVDSNVLDAGTDPLKYITMA
jgi:HK97 family phage major capsid protein